MDPIVDVVAEVPVDDLYIIRATLNSAFHQNTVLDLAEQYRKLQQRPTATKLTQALQQALTLVQTYIDMATQAEASDPEVPNE